jgi:hypothetical protein
LNQNQPDLGIPIDSIRSGTALEPEKRLTPILRGDDPELFVDQRLYAHRFLVQMLKRTKALHPFWLAAATRCIISRQLAAHGLHDELFK